MTDPNEELREDAAQQHRERRPVRRALLTGAALVTAGALAVTGAVIGRVTAGTSTGSAASSTRQPVGSPWSQGYRGWEGGNTQGQAPYGWQEGSGGSGSQALATASGKQEQGLVRIVATSLYDGSTSAGTGMVLSSDGEVVTNNHVVQGATQVRVKVMATGRSYRARVLGTDVRDDVAVLQLNGASGLTTVTTATSAVQRGDRVTAIGDADGTAGHLTASSGTVTRLHRSITTQDQDGSGVERLRGLIQIDADVVAGDSGGAVVDGDGQVVGMTTAASSGPEGSSGNISGYAIPIAKVLSIVSQVDSGSQTSRVQLGYDAFLGIELANAGDATVRGVLPGTPAARAGLAAGDTITALDGHSAAAAAALRSLIGAHQPGNRVRLTWTDTAGTRHTATVRLMRGPVA